MDLLARIQFQDITRQKIEQVLKALAGVSEQINNIALQASNEGAFAGNGSDQSAIDALFAGYVMNDQRANHLQALGQTSDAAAAAAAEPSELPAIELF